MGAFATVDNDFARQASAIGRLASFLDVAYRRRYVGSSLCAAVQVTPGSLDFGAFRIEWNEEYARNEVYVAVEFVGDGVGERVHRCVRCSRAAQHRPFSC
jgi:hypothetical protein